VARVLASDAKVILADEPTSSLDGKNSSKVMDLLFEAAKGKTLLVVSHDHRIEKKFNSVLKFEELVRR
jgi:putative ABC transport system ATP-binding protein